MRWGSATVTDVKDCQAGPFDVVAGIDTFLRDAAGEYAADDVLLVGASASYGFGMGFVRRVRVEA